MDQPVGRSKRSEECRLAHCAELLGALFQDAERPLHVRRESLRSARSRRFCRRRCRSRRSVAALIAAAQAVSFSATEVSTASAATLRGASGTSGRSSCCRPTHKQLSRAIGGMRWYRLRHGRRLHHRVRGSRTPAGRLAMPRARVYLRHRIRLRRCRRRLARHRGVVDVLLTGVEHAFQLVLEHVVLRLRYVADEGRRRVDVQHGLFHGVTDKTLLREHARGLGQSLVVLSQLRTCHAKKVAMDIQNEGCCVIH
mmetsp:Transcript_55490/g.156176  ORF Transcript_55490/g.156176 Transcript_55490/m.156176 type:complete len:254 (-) Transcript_55490:71-832(-)